MGSIRVGTSGYGYLEWIGSVYPHDTAREDCIARYAELFSTVELNESSYLRPSADDLSRLASASGSGLAFSVKANAELTHRIDPASWRETARAFVESLEPLREAGRLEAVLLQFPSSFSYGAPERRYLDAVLGSLGGAPLAVEFRNHEWYNNRVFDALRSRSVAIASIDLPELAGLPPVIDLVTAPLAYIRLHGRNARSWWGSDSATRYDYLYSDAELRALSERVRVIASRAETVLVYFNNYRRGQAAVNAMAFSSLATELGLGTPSALPVGGGER